jgi:uncharacterized membrane protein
MLYSQPMHTQRATIFNIIRTRYARRAAWWLAAVGILALLLLAAETVLLTARRPMVSLSPGSRDASLHFSGFHQPEEDERGSYRWTAGNSTISVPRVGQGRTTVLALHIGPTFAGHPVSSFEFGFSGQHTATIALEDRPRTLLVLVPDDALRGPEVAVTLHSKTVTVPPDTRSVGLRIERATLLLPGSPVVWIAPLYALFQVCVLLLGALLLARVGVPMLPAVGVLALVAEVLLLFTIGQTTLAYPYMVRWTVALAVLGLLTSWLLPLAERHLAWIAAPRLMRAFWAVALLACVIRLAGSLHPLFEAFDLGLNVERFYKTMSGNLVVTSRSIEFRNNITVYPPGGYIVLLPGALLNIPPPLLIQSSLALIDGFGALTIALLARVLGASGRAAVLSALVYAAVPIHLTALWFGLTAQIFGQALTAPLAIALLLALHSNRWRDWLLAGLLLTVALLSHIGVAITAVAWLGLVWLILAWRRTVPTSTLWRFAQVVIVGSVISIVGIYGAVAVLKVQQFLVTIDQVQTSGYVPAYGLIVRAFPVSFTGLGLVLIAPGLLLLWKRLPRGGDALAAGWLGVVLVFLAIELVSALQVRYIYFVVPLACFCAGLLLDTLARRGGTGRLVTLAAVLWLLTQGSLSWYIAASEDAMMSMIPLLR